ncbi:hypothetical protein TNCV_213271 [Trichonephila clavipes]|nr:hypothetical protein TNCV_213271 [Trichonephila clavipes]
MERKIDGLRYNVRKSSSPGSGNEGKREIVLNRRPEVYRGKYRCVQPKINLLKKTFLCLPFVCSVLCMFPLDSPLVSMERKKRRTAADSVESEWPLWHAAKSKAKQSSRAGAAK